MASILFMTKDVAPPWTDGSKHLAREVASHLRRHRAIVLSSSRNQSSFECGEEQLGFEPSSRFLSSQIDAATRWLLGPSCDLVHCIFTPTARNRSFGKLARTIRSSPAVHTIPAASGVDFSKPFFADALVFVSEWGRKKFDATAVHRSSEVLVVSPTVGNLSRPSDEQINSYRQRVMPIDASYLLSFPGDLDFDDSALQLVDAVAESGMKDEIVLAVAARPKTPRTQKNAQDLQARAKQKGVRIAMLGLVSDMPLLLASSDLVAMPNEEFFAKVDIPLVLLEALQLGTAVLVNARGPARELGDSLSTRASNVFAWDPLAQPLSKNIHVALRNKDLRLQAVQDTRELLRTRYNAAKAAALYEDLYDRVLSAHRKH